MVRRSSKIVAVLAFLLAAALVSVYVPLLRDSRPEFTETDARQMLDGVAAALSAESVHKTVAYASPDASIVGRKVTTITRYLGRAFAAVRNLDVQFSDMRYGRSGDTVTLDTRARACEKQPGGSDCAEIYYDQRAQFTVQRRATRQMGGLFTTYEWKVTRITAPALPDAGEWLP